MSSDFQQMPAEVARRTFLRHTAAGLGAVALADLLQRDGQGRGKADAAEAPVNAAAKNGDRWPGVVRPLHVPPRAKRVIFLYMSGGPSQFETLDFKPALTKLHGQPMPESYTKGQPIAQLQNQKLVCLAPQFAFRRWGESQQEIAESLPHIGSIADQICIVRSMVTEAINHDPAHTFMNSGTLLSGRPSMGSWINYGLGSEADNLPGFVVMVSQGGRSPQPISSRQWHHGFLPGRFQGVQIRSSGDPVHYIQSPAGVAEPQQAEVVRAVQELDALNRDALDDPEVATRIQQYELAFRMQSSVPKLLNLSDEPQHVLDQYGVRGLDGSFATNCLLARRMAEHGVRFIQLYHRGWDHHNDVKMFVQKCAGFCDRASAALINDLRQRGMLQDTLVVWGGEFGRTPMSQIGKGQDPGRDHHMRAFSLWMAGGGIRGGMTHGATDELGYHAVENVVHVHDLHATMLHLLGIDHRKLNVRAQGRDFRLTDVAGRVVREVLA